MFFTSLSDLTFTMNGPRKEFSSPLDVMKFTPVPELKYAQKKKIIGILCSLLFFSLSAFLILMYATINNKGVAIDEYVTDLAVF